MEEGKFFFCWQETSDGYEGDQFEEPETIEKGNPSPGPQQQTDALDLGDDYEED